MLLNFRLMKFLWLVALLIALITFGVLNFTVGITRDNILYFIPISVAALFKHVEWEPIRHTVSKSVEDLEKSE